ncbi:MAG: transposase [Nostoc sp.]|uniref:transposase n=1 Tax=Nostoc sp. TaxID=1180 RepID=UPI002FFBD30B
MNVQLHKVVSDITGITGMAIIRAITAGETDPQILAAKKHYRAKRSEAEIAAALNGDYRSEHIFVLQQELHLYDVYQTQIAACDRQIQECLAQFSNKVNLNESPLPQPKHPRHKPQGNQPAFDLRTHLYRISGVDFRAIDGLGILTVQTIISEVGLDPTRFPTVKHFTSWLGLCPCNRITGGKIKSSKTRLVVNPATNAFRMATNSRQEQFCRVVLFTVVYGLAWVHPKRSLLLLIS